METCKVNLFTVTFMQTYKADLIRRTKECALITSPWHLRVKSPSALLAAIWARKRLLAVAIFVLVKRKRYSEIFGKVCYRN